MLFGGFWQQGPLLLIGAAEWLGHAWGFTRPLGLGLGPSDGSLPSAIQNTMMSFLFIQLIQVEYIPPSLHQVEATNLSEITVAALPVHQECTSSVAMSRRHFRIDCPYV